MDVEKIEINDNDDNDALEVTDTRCTIDLTEDDPQNDEIEILNIYYVDSATPPSNTSEPISINDNDSIVTQPAYDYSSTEFDNIDVVEEVVSSVSPNTTGTGANPSTSNVTNRRSNRTRRIRSQRRRPAPRRSGDDSIQIDATLTGANLVGEMRLSEAPRWILEPSDTEAAEYSDSNDSDAILFMGEHFIPSVSVYDFQPRIRPTPRNTLFGNSLKGFRRRFNERSDLPRKPSKKSDDPVNTSTPYDPITGSLRLPVCPICQDNLSEIFTNKRQLLSTSCGHLFCSDCLPTYCAIPPKTGTQLRCPVCSATLQSENPYHNVYW